MTRRLVAPLVAAFVLIALLSFQNCSGTAPTSETIGSSRRSVANVGNQSVGGGDGYGYDGKVRDYVRWGACTVGPKMRSVIKVEDGKVLLSREDCKDINPPRVIDMAQIKQSEKRDGDALIYNGQLFEFYRGLERKLVRYCRYDETKNPKPNREAATGSLRPLFAFLGLDLPPPSEDYPPALYPRELFIWKKANGIYLYSLYLKEVAVDLDKIADLGKVEPDFDRQFLNGKDSMVRLSLDVNDTEGETEGRLTFRELTNSYSAPFDQLETRLGPIAGGPIPMFESIRLYFGMPSLKEPIAMRCYYAPY